VTTESQIQLGDLDVLVVRKAVKNIHLGVYPPDGRVRIAVPSAMSDTLVRARIAERLPWIRRQQARFGGQARESLREMVNGESHWYLGRRYRLRVVQSPHMRGVRLPDHSTLELHCPPGAGASERRAVLEDWYREQLRATAAPLVKEWADKMGVTVADWRIRKMKTKWGSCGIEGRRIWLNLELAKKPRRSIEYVVIHELAHLRVRRHGDDFRALLDETLPNWEHVRAELGALPIPA
jgi:predicted metal-dependent hydrolase